MKRMFYNTAILAMVCLVLGGYALYRQRVPAREKPSAFTFDPKEAEEIEVRSGLDDQPIVLRRSSEGAGGEGTWRMVEPIATQADQNLVNSLLDKSKDVTIEQDLTDRVAKRDMDEYGLKSPLATLKIRLKSGKTYRLRLGSQSANNQSVYALLDDNRVVLVPSAIKDEAKRDVMGFRDKRVLPLESSNVEKVVFVHPDRRLELRRRSADEWRIAAPVQSAADGNGVDSFLSQLGGFQADSFVAEKPQGEDLARYGLDKPRLLVEVWERKKKKPTALSIGKAKEETLPPSPGSKETRRVVNGYYARNSASQPVFLLSQFNADELLKKGLADFRSKTLLSFSTHDVRKVEIRRSGQTLVCEKEGGDAAAQWKLTAFGAGISKAVKGLADKTVVEDVLSDLQGVQVTRYTDNPPTLKPFGLDPPQEEIALWMERVSGEPTKTVLIGKREAKEVIVKLKDDDAVAHLAPTALTKVKPTLAQLRDKQVLKFEVAEVLKFVLRHSGKSLVVQREGDQRWRITAPQAAEGDDGKITTLLYTLADLRGAEVVEDNPQDLAKYGLDVPQVAVEIYLKGEKSRKGSVVLIGKRNPQGDKVYALRQPFQPAVYLVDTFVAEGLKKDVKDLTLASP